MTYLKTLLVCAFLLIHTTSASYPPASAGEKLNVLLICVDDLRPELHCFGAEYIHSPNIDALASSGVQFTRHYVQAPTCGASRYALLTGRYGPASNSALFSRAKAMRDESSSTRVYPSLPAWFRRHGYTTVSVGKVSHHPGGRGGSDWDDDEQLEMPESWDRHLLPAGDWQHPRGWMHGLAHGEIRKKASDMDVFQSLDGNDTIYPDGNSTNEALRQLDQLANDSDQPFFLAFGILRPHLPFGAPAKYMETYREAELPPITNSQKPRQRSTWHSSGEFMKYNRWGRDPNKDAAFALEVRRHYAACVSYADAQVGKIMDRLRRRGLADNTIVVLWGDHGWHLGEHAIWGKHALFEESLRSPLIVVAPKLADERISSAKSTSTVVETIDIYPTLCELASLPVPDFALGNSLVPTMITDSPATTEEATDSAASYFRNAETIRTDRYRFILHSDGYSELYDHLHDPGETENVAKAHPQLVRNLRDQLREKLAERK